LPEHLREMVLFALHTGLRETELTGLKWSEENLNMGNFVLKSHRTKNSENRIVPLKITAKAIIENQQVSMMNRCLLTKANLC